MEPWIFWVVIRLLLPFTILRWPFWGTALCAAVDMLDYKFLHPATSALTEYQMMDKVLDTYYLGFAAFTSLSWKDRVAKKISIVSYLFRVFGVLLFTVTQFRPLLFIFPNFFENFFLFYHIYRYFAKKEKLFTTNLLFFILIPALLIPKLFQEYFVHIIQIHPVDLFKSLYAPQYPDLPLVIIQTTVYLLLPIAALRWIIIRNRNKKTQDYKQFTKSEAVIKPIMS